MSLIIFNIESGFTSISDINLDRDLMSPLTALLYSVFTLLFNLIYLPKPYLYNDKARIKVYVSTLNPRFTDMVKIMCRIAGFKVSEPRYLNYMLYSFSYVSLIDLYIPIKTPSIHGHVDGWGLGICDARGVFINMKACRPFYLDVQRVQRILTSMEFPLMGLLHIRRASVDQPICLVHAHPYICEVNGSILLMAHNGGINKELVKERYKLAIDVNKVTDSYIYFYLILESYKRRGNLVDAIEDVVKELVSMGAVVFKTKGSSRATSLNAVLMLVNGDKCSIYVVEDWRIFSSELRKYYEIYSLSKDDNLVICSSSIADKLRQHGFKTFEPKVEREIKVNDRVIRVLLIS